MRVIIHHVIFSNFATFIFSSSMVNCTYNEVFYLQRVDWWIVRTVMCLKYRLPCVTVELQHYHSQPKLLSNPLSTVDTGLCNGRVNAFHGSCVFTLSYLLIPRRGMKLHMSQCYQVSGFPYLCNDEARCHHWSLSPHLIPPVRHYQTDVNIKEEPIYKSVFVLGNRLRFQGGHKRRWSGPRTTHLTRSSLPRGLSIHHCHKRAFLPSTSCRYCPSLLP